MGQYNHRTNQSHISLHHTNRLSIITRSKNPQRENAGTKKALKSAFLYNIVIAYFLLREAKRLLNLSTRPPVSMLRCLPV
ncbi:MAG: hypothetical protein ACJAUL_002245 [Paraglaciecola sp.]|jgi:hypothetical protein